MAPAGSDFAARPEAVTVTGKVVLLDDPDVDSVGNSPRALTSTHPAAAGG